MKKETLKNDDVQKFILKLVMSLSGTRLSYRKKSENRNSVRINSMNSKLLNRLRVVNEHSLKLQNVGKVSVS